MYWGNYSSSSAPSAHFALTDCIAHSYQVSGCAQVERMAHVIRTHPLYPERMIGSTQFSRFSNGLNERERMGADDSGTFSTMHF